MKKAIYLIMLVVLCSFAYAGSVFDGVDYSKLLEFDIFNRSDGLLGNTMGLNQAWINNDCANLTNGSEVINASVATDFGELTSVAGGTDEIVYWVQFNLSKTLSGGLNFDLKAVDGDLSGTNVFTMDSGVAPDFKICNVQSSIVPIASKDYLLKIRLNRSTTQAYLNLSFTNGTQVNYSNCGTNANFVGGFGGYHWNTGDTIFIIDNFMITNYTLYGENLPYTSGSVDTTPPTITVTYPLNLTYNDYDGWLNLTTDENANCSVNDTYWIKNTTISTSTSFYFYNQNYSILPENQNYINISCWDSSNNNASTTANFRIDVTNPVAVTTLSLNNTITTHNLTYQINYSDNIKLYSININTSGGYNHAVYNINQSTYIFNDTILMTNFSTGVNYLNTTVCDSSTAIAIADYDNNIDIITKEITYSFDYKGLFARNTITIQPKNIFHFSDAETYKDGDRYKFNFIRYKTYKEEYETFIIKGTHLDIVGDDDYHTGWIVDRDLKKWIHFDNDEGYKATIRKISDSEVEVTTKGEFFHSIGDLNCFTYNYEFYNYVTSLFYTAQNIEHDSHNFILKIDKGNTPLTIRSAILEYNNTAYTTSIVNDSTSINFSKTLTLPAADKINISKVFRFNYTLNTHSLSTNFTNHSLYQIYIDNCSTTNNVTTTTLGIKFVDAVNKNSISPSFDSIFKVWKGSEALHRNYTFQSDLVPSYSFCINPNWTSYTSNINFEYELSGYTSNAYVLDSYSLTNITKNLTLYMTSSGNSTAITINVVDGFGDGLQGMTVEAWEYVLSTNSFNLVSMGETDVDGTVKIYLDVSSNKYKFLVKDSSGTVVYTSITMKLESTEYTFKVLTGTDNPYNTLLTGLTRTLSVSTINILPYVISYSWNDVSNLTSSVCLNVTNSTLNSSKSLFGSCSSNSSGEISYTFNASEGYFAIYGSAFASADGRLYVLDTDSIELRTAYDVFGEEGMVYAFMFVGTMSFIGIGAAMFSTMGGILSVVLLMVSSIIMYLFGFMNIGLGGIMFLGIMSIVIVTVLSEKR